MREKKGGEYIFKGEARLVIAIEDRKTKVGGVSVSTEGHLSDELRKRE